MISAPSHGARSVNLRYIRIALCLLVATATLPALAQRQPVLRQIELPHPYYYREMYLPQLTSGPSALSWRPDGRELVYSMAGSLWAQRIDSPQARQLTAGDGYDYQPDSSPDGRWIVYASYRHDAVELWVLDTDTGTTSPLLQNRAVNVEPRFSPDGRRIAFVSTAFKGHFHVFAGDFADGKLTAVERLTGETVSTLPRYYYSAVDHEISPVWSRDGAEILFISNRGHIYGTGGLWRMPARAGAEAHEIHYEETNWRARPDVSPDGARLVYASYTGRPWHNLWLLPAEGGADSLPLGFADSDQVNPRWSPDGSRIAFIANRGGNTGIELVDVPGGVARPLLIAQRSWLHPMGRLHVLLRHADGSPAPARIAVTDGQGHFHAPHDAWIRADDGYDRRERAFEAHYFHARGVADVEVPPGPVTIEVMQGFTRPFESHRLTVSAGATAELAVDIDAGRWSVPATGRWVSGDLHVHMNYAGSYRDDPLRLIEQARSEDLDIVESLIVNKEQRFPDLAWNGIGRDPVSDAHNLVVHGQEYHTSVWGHLGLPGIDAGVILPGYVGYPGTAMASLVPSNADIADLAHARHALVGYVHPFDEAPHPLDAHEPLSNELPVDVALGKVDYMEILGFSDHRYTADVWYRLLNLGFRLPAGAGTDAMANFASLRGPVGMNRVFVRVPEGVLDNTAFLQGLRQGRSLATNGPLLGFTLGGQEVGDELQLPSAPAKLAFTARLRSLVPVEKLDVVCNGRVARSLLGSRPATQGEYGGTVTLPASGWCVLRAETAGAHHPVLDNYVYATTSPVYVTIGAARARSAEDVRYFLAWLDRVQESTSAWRWWNSPQEKAHVLGQIAAARAVYEKMR